MKEKVRPIPLMDKHGIYHIMVFITHTSPTNWELSLTAVLNWMEDQLAKGFFQVQTWQID